MIKDEAKLLPLLLTEATLKNVTFGLSQRELLNHRVRENLSLNKEYSLTPRRREQQ